MFLNSESKNNLLYTGRQFDYETGLQFNRMRYYSPNLGIFVIKDPLYLEGNKYCYACNNPVMLKDPYGTLPPWLWTFFMVAIIATTTCGRGGEGAYCGYISVTLPDKECTITNKCKTGYTCEKTNKTDVAGNIICECKAIT